jgi:hypothetical protein
LGFFSLLELALGLLHLDRSLVTALAGKTRLPVGGVLLAQMCALSRQLGEHHGVLNSLCRKVTSLKAIRFENRSAHRSSTKQ